jgi:DNA polymerase-1
MSKKKLLIIDTFNFLHRAYHALPLTLTNSEGQPTNAVYGVASMLISVFDQIKPDYVIAAMDSKEPTFRVEDFTGYKAHRKPMDDALATQIPMVIEIMEAFKIKILQVNGYEADDIMGTLTEKHTGNGLDIIIVSNDRDLWQLVDADVLVMSPQKGNTMEWIGPQQVEKKFGFKPKQMIDYKALRGDPSDNIPGVHGVGDKTAKKLIEEYGSVEEIYKNIALIKPDSLREKLANNAEEAVMSLHLATIIKDVPIDDFDLSEAKYTEFSKLAVKDVLQKYNFKSLIKRLGFDTNESAKKVSEDQLTLL